MAMKKRYVKRLVRKLLVLLLAIVGISLVTTWMVERRMRPLPDAPVDNLDPNGDPMTPVFRAADIQPTRKAARPPFQDRNLVRDPLSNKKGGFRLPETEGERKDWHDHAAMEADTKRIGLGEQGQPASIENEEDRDLEFQQYRKNGFNGLLSDRISVNRSVPDVRQEACKSRKYLAKLPDVSVIFIFYNEHYNTLLRSIHSVINRTPKELLKQIVLVDDGSDWESLKHQLDNYAEIHFPHLVTIVRNPERRGLIGARIAGAKVAVGKVMVFFDSHIETNYNWLPPLLEPIAIDPKISTCPMIDSIDHSTFAYAGTTMQGARGGFDWKMYYKQLPVLPEDAVDKSMPFRSPVMMGGLFAISTDFFWDLGGYDDELDIWGGEQYELSFKIWMCGGMLLDVPCSRVAHIFRGPMDPRPHPRNNANFVARNHKRVAEVWMDDYKKYVYERDPETYDNVDAGDLTRQIGVRKRLQCKDFHWFMNEVAPDFLEKFPPVEPPSYASGTIQNVANPIYCLDTMGRGMNEEVGMFSCAENKVKPQLNQFWKLSKQRELRIPDLDICLDVQEARPNATVWMWVCHNMGGNQFWYYDREEKWLVHGTGEKRCMEGFIVNGKPHVYVNPCQPGNDRQRWRFGSVDAEMLDKFFDELTT
ncbi:hypothetical protein KR018_011632 [Drosophila ironensis]|nr:hypothetical protein KR018_011632 [Drosophila ironensis]